MTYRMALVWLACVGLGCGASAAQYVDTRRVCAAVGRAADTMGLALDEASTAPETPPRVKVLMLTATQYAAEAHDACFVDAPAE